MFKFFILAQIVNVEGDSKFGFPEFVHHNVLYLNEEKFVKDDFLFMCCEFKCLKLDEDVEKLKNSISNKGFSFEGKKQISESCAANCEAKTTSGHHTKVS